MTCIFRTVKEMGGENEVPLIANAIIQLQHNKIHEFMCSVCTDERSFEDWERHIGNEVHVRTLEQYNLTFEKKGLKIHCTICGTDINRDELKAHGKLHLIVPWHEPDDKYRTFFENHIIQWKNKLYCCLCEEIFHEWSTAFLHINDWNHRKHQEELIPLPVKFFSELPVDVTFELLVTNALVPFDDKTLKCEMCNICNIIEFTKIVHHVRSFLHSWDEITFQDKLKERKALKTDLKLHQNCLLTESMSNQLVDTTTNEDQCCQTCCYLEKFDGANYHCNVCDRLVFASTRNTHIHVVGEFHANSLKKYGCNNILLKDEVDTYHCECCKCDVSGRKELYLHIKGIHHLVRHIFSEFERKFLMKIPTKVEDSTVTLTVSTSPMKTSPPVSGTNNASYPEKYGCDKPSRKTDNIFYCQCCNRYIIKLKRVCSPLKEKNRMDTLAVSDKQQSPIGDKNPITVEVPKQPEPRAVRRDYRSMRRYCNRRPRAPKPLEPLYPDIVSQTIPSNYIKTENSTDSHCMICNVALSTATEIQNHVVCSDHKNATDRYGCDNVTLVAGKLYYCRCCNCRIFGHDNVYLHVKGRQHNIERMAQIREKKLEELSRQPVPTKVALSSILTKEVTKMVEEVKSREAAFAPRPHRNRVRFPNPQKSVLKDRTHCNVCNVTFNSTGELHSHSASHFSGDFVRFSANKNSNSPINGTFSKFQMELSNALESNQMSTETAKTSEKILENCGSSDINTKPCESTSTNGTLFASIKETSICDSEDGSDTEFQIDRRTPVKTIMQRVVQLSNFNNDHIYDMKDKLGEIELGMKLCFVTDLTSIYCLVCRKTVENTRQNYIEHLRSLDHCDSLEKIAKDDELFDRFPEQFSELALAYEYMEETSDEVIRCLVCHEEVANVDDKIRDHIDERHHEQIRDEMHVNAQQNFDDVKSIMQCNWYNVQNYWCVLCSENFHSEISFSKHLASAKHDKVERSDKVGKALIYDFCAPCALLWYGYRCTHAYHCTITSHKWLVQDGHYVLHELPESAKDLLATPAQYIKDTIENLESVATTERETEQTLLQALKNAVSQRFCNAKVYTYGSRVFGSGGPESDVNVFLDCGGMYNGNAKSKEQLLSLATSVHQCLSLDPKSWELDELSTCCRTPVIRAHHRITGLSCDISFENGLSVENTKLIKSFSDVFPPCRNMMLLLKKWLVHCKLSGPDRICSYALYWLVIFYLQKETILPSIATLIKMNNKSYEIAGWEVGVTREYSYNKAESKLSTEEMLIRFFMFYADFDFRHDVICPLLGDAVKKRDFADHRNLPKEMRSYVYHMKKLADPEPLRVDSPMCIQDPLDLQHNITKTVSKVLLCRFRTYCSKSVNVLQCPS